jgi:hypothetical protein
MLDICALQIKVFFHVLELEVTTMSGAARFYYEIRYIIYIYIYKLTGLDSLFCLHR